MRALSIAIGLCAILAPALGVKRAAQADLKPLEWWQQSVVYQIYPRSYQDSVANGTGDLNGISSRLDYFVDIGIDTIWVSPFYKSPMKDFGYDISDFRDVDPIFGDMDDFKNMLVEFKKRGLKLIMDMVPNHSSDEHEWFKKSINRIEPYTDYYTWKDPKGFDSNGKPIVPNNWVSVFGGSAWEWSDQRQQFYLHQFDKGQPDFNYTNIRVRNEILAVVKYWLDLGVDGFRVDAVAWIYEDPEWRDNPENPNRLPETTPSEYAYWDHVHTYNLPGVPVFLADMRQLLDVYSSADGRRRIMMVEAGVPDDSIAAYYGTEDKPVAHFPFNFHLLEIKPTMNASQILSLIDVWYEILPYFAWATFLLGNHDQKRAATRWTNGSIDGANMINLLLQGTAVTYQGEELGMTDTFLSWEETVDPQACNQDPSRYHEFSRDPSRTPFHWDNSTNAGFSNTTGKTWLPVNSNYPTVNVASELVADESHLKVYIELLKLRNTDTWRYGSYESHAFNEDRILGFSRIPPSGVASPAFLVLVNLSDDEVTVDSGIFADVPTYGTIAVRSVNFKNQAAVVGSQINTRSIPLGPRDSVVVLFTPQ